MMRVLMDPDIAAAYGDSVYIAHHGYPMVGDEYLHRIVMRAPHGKVVDHINRNKLDCRRQNLRLASHAENIRNSKFRSSNTSGFKGVYFCKITERWRAQIRVGKRREHLGRFDTAKEAGAKYDEAARRLHGEFAVLNG